MKWAINRAAFRIICGVNTSPPPGLNISSRECEKDLPAQENPLESIKNLEYAQLSYLQHLLSFIPVKNKIKKATASYNYKCQCHPMTLDVQIFHLRLEGAGFYRPVVAAQSNSRHYSAVFVYTVSSALITVCVCSKASTTCQGLTTKQQKQQRPYK